jgi:hypothetical protein
MCLFIRDIQKQVATEPVKVYKLLDIHDMPPYFPSDAYHVGINEPETQETYTVTAGVYWVGAGYLHAYTDKATAIQHAKNITWLYQKVTESGTIKYKIVEMYRTSNLCEKEFKNLIKNVLRHLSDIVPPCISVYAYKI